MLKITLVGDAHLNDKTPSSRQDDFPLTSINKLEELFKICLANDYKNLIFLGDMFHKPTQSLIYLVKVMNIFTKFKNHGINVYSIIGNHDVVYSKSEYIDKSSLGILFASNLVKPLDKLEFDEVNIYGFNYDEDIPILSDKENKFNLCVAHRFYNAKFENDLDKHKCKALNYDIYALGHEHLPYAPLVEDDFAIYRPGRFMRGTADNYNIEGEGVYIDTLKFDNGHYTHTRDIIPTTKSSEIFTIKALNKDVKDRELEALADKVNILLDKMDLKSDSGSIFTLLDSLPMDNRIKVRIESYLNSIGVLRDNII